MFQAWLGEDREDRRQLHPQHPAGEQVHEEDDGEGQEADDRHRLQDVQDRHQYQAGPAALRGPGRVGEGEEEGTGEGREHPQRRTQGVARQIRRVETDRLHRREGGDGVARAAGEGEDQPADAQDGGDVEQVGEAPDRGESREGRTGHWAFLGRVPGSPYKPALRLSLRQSMAVRLPAGAVQPVEPKPPLPRSLGPENASTTVSCGRRTGTNSSCANRSPGVRMIGSVPGALRFHALTMIGPV